MPTMSKALIPGSFDPITLGHLDIIKRCSKLFDEVVVLIAKNSQKNYMLCSQKRASLATDAVKDLPNVKVDIFDGLLVEYAFLHNIDVTVKGIRNDADYQYELNMATTNEKLAKSMYNTSFETVFLPCSDNLSAVSSSLVRLLLSKNGDLSDLVPNPDLLKELLK